VLLSSNWIFWLFHHRKSIACIFFVLKDSKKIIDVHGIQGMKCVMCHGNGKTQTFVGSNNTRDKKRHSMSYTILYIWCNSHATICNFLTINIYVKFTHTFQHGE
jgi:hypothetical protein